MSDSIPGWLRFILLGAAVAAGLAIAVLLLLPDDEPSPYNVPPVMQRPPPSLALAPLASPHVVDDPAPQDYSAVRLAQGAVSQPAAPVAAAGGGAARSAVADAAKANGAKLEAASSASQANDPLKARQAVAAAIAAAAPPVNASRAVPSEAPANQALANQASANQASANQASANQASAKSGVAAAQTLASESGPTHNSAPQPFQTAALSSDKPIGMAGNPPISQPGAQPGTKANAKPDAPAPADAAPADAAPAGATAAGSGDVTRPTFDVVTMSTEGSTVIAGRALPDADIVVRNGHDDLGHVKADQRGNWVMLPDKNLAAGPQSLTVAERLLDGTEIVGKDHVDFIVPAKPTATLAAATGAAARAPGGSDSGASVASISPGGQVVVKSGENLWRLAKSAYGSGPRYVVIYRANQDKIREPDRIYPGQALEVPSEPIEAGSKVTPASSSKSR
jgi:nucleoid-associated protein YgaU